MWYGVLVFFMVSWMRCMVECSWLYGMLQSIRSVRVEYIVRTSYVTTLYIDHWKGRTSRVRSGRVTRPDPTGEKFEACRPDPIPTRPARF